MHFHSGHTNCACKMYFKTKNIFTTFTQSMEKIIYKTFNNMSIRYNN